jgi:hypothetical protein
MAVSNQKDIRVTIISKIWAYATASIALSVLFAGPGRSWKVILLPSTIALGATISTVAIWGKSNRRRHDFLLPSENLDELKQRIENLEEIATNSNMPTQYQFTQLDRTNPDRSCVSNVKASSLEATPLRDSTIPKMPTTHSAVD